MERRTKAALWLVLASVFLGESLTGSTPPLGLIPLFPIFFALYGSGVLLARELWVRRGGGAARLVLAALAYGVYEEALVLRTWFDPPAPQVAFLGGYGDVGGTNIVWAAWASPWLGALSVFAAVMFGDLLFPDFRGKPLLGRRGIAACFGGVAAVAVLMLVLAKGAAPPALPFAAAGGLFAALLVGAFALRGDPLRPRAAASRLPPWGFALVGALWASWQFFSAFALAGGAAPAEVGAVVIAGGWAATVVALPRFTSLACWRRDTALFFAGVVAFFALRAVFVPGGAFMQLVGALALILLWRYRRRLKARAALAPQPAG